MSKVLPNNIIQLVSGLRPFLFQLITLFLPGAWTTEYTQNIIWGVIVDELINPYIIDKVNSL